MTHSRRRPSENNLTLRRISPGRLWGVQQITGAAEQRSGAPPRLHQPSKDDHR